MSCERPAFDCKMCGRCCRGEGGIVVSREDQERMSECLGLSLEDFVVEYTIPMGDKRVLTVGKDDYCVFFQEGRGCSVHAFKPDICRAWPFFRGNMIDAVSWELAQDSCPGIDLQVDHAEFVRQGCRYLRESGLLRRKRSDVAAALIVDCPEDDASGE